MALTDSKLAYEDCFKVLDRAIESANGIRIKFASRGDALRFRHRIHYARNIDRKENRENFTHDHPMYGRSLYDPVTIRDPVKDGAIYWLYIKSLSTSNLEIEDIPDEHQAPDGDHGTAEGESEAPGSREKASPQVAEAVRTILRRI